MKFASPYVCSLIGLSLRNERLITCMELLTSSLDRYLVDKPKLGAMKKLDIISQIRLGLLWIHNQNPPIIHLDLKMENILIDKEGIAKISYFGLSAVLPVGYQYLRIENMTVGNLAHMSPEVLEKERFSQSADVYSFAILIWEIMQGQHWAGIVSNYLAQQKVDKYDYFAKFKLCIKS